jgi:hypothetical protein
MSRSENPNLRQRNFPPSALAYDEELRAKLADAIMVTAKDGCTNDGSVFLALHEIRDALVDILAYFVAIAHHRRNGEREHLYRRAASVIDIDRNNRGRA